MWQLYSSCGSAALLVPSELLLSTHSPTSEGWTAELAVGLSLVVPTTRFEPTGVDLTRFETLRLNHSATPQLRSLTFLATSPCKSGSKWILCVNIGRGKGSQGSQGSKGSKDSKDSKDSKGSKGRNLSTCFAIRGSGGNTLIRGALRHSHQEWD